MGLGVDVTVGVEVLVLVAVFVRVPVPNNASLVALKLSDNAVCVARILVAVKPLKSTTALAVAFDLLSAVDVFCATAMAVFTAPAVDVL